MEIRIVPVKNAGDIRKFVYFPDDLYRDDPNYTPYIKSDLRNTLKKLILKQKTYRALMALDGEGNIAARVLFTVARNKQLKTERCGFYSMYECIDDLAVSNAILSEMRAQLTEMGAEFISGTFFPFDPDNRRGILVKGFERPPLVFTSYNPPYYAAQLEAFGMEKEIDMLQFRIPTDDKTVERMGRLATFATLHNDIHVDMMNKKDLERDIRDYCTVMKTATTEINYQDAPTEEEIRRVLKQWKKFLNPELVLIARRNDDNSPVGIAMAIPDYFELFRQMKGELNLRGLRIFLTGRKKIHAMRAMLQYVIPSYQNRGAITSLVYGFYRAIRKYGYDYIEGGTILETNQPSISVMNTLHADCTRVYRIYTMKIQKTAGETEDADS